MATLAKTDLLVLDDWGLAPFTDIQGRDLLEVIDDRCQIRSTIIASQLPIDHCHIALSDPILAGAILDRLVHNAHKIVMKGESMRKVTSLIISTGVLYRDCQRRYTPVCSFSFGITARFQLEWALELNRNQWPNSSEYAPSF